MQIQVGDLFPVRNVSKDLSRPGDFYTLTRAAHSQGIFKYRTVKRPNKRIPAFILYSNNLGKLSEDNPWLDVIDPENGYALYHGDNKKPRDPFEAKGNGYVGSVASQYDDPTKRIIAPPMILFEKVNTPPGRKGTYRRFVGYGIPKQLRIQSQRSKEGTFSNLVFEIVLFSLTEEHEKFDWQWIEARRDKSLSATEAGALAPAAWKKWVKKGEAVLDDSRRRVYGVPILTRDQQTRESARDGLFEILERIHGFFVKQKGKGERKAHAHAFEGLASWVACRVLGPGSQRGWVTRASGDGGIDFVNSLQIGNGVSQTKVVVLGQAKCNKPNNGVGGRDLARTAARLKRGWIGVVVTTSFFTESAQRELLTDKYPIVLISGARVAQEVQGEIIKTGMPLIDLLEREKEWYEKNELMLEPDRIVSGDHWGIQIGGLDLNIPEPS